jgi:hypothetical protein
MSHFKKSVRDGLCNGAIMKKAQPSTRGVTNLANLSVIEAQSWR